MLSAQSTDTTVNQVTARLFPIYGTAERLCALGVDGLIPYIRSLGLYRNKAKHIWQTACILQERYDGRVPADREALEALPGVGRKTASVVLANAFAQPALAVDTHVFRVAHRLGWSQASSPQATERDLQKRIPKSQWANAHHWLIFHGRQTCKARRPLCTLCLVADICPSAPEVTPGT